MNSPETKNRVVDSVVSEYGNQPIQALIDARELSVVMTKTFDALLEERSKPEDNPVDSAEVERAKAWITAQMDKTRALLQKMSKTRVADVVANAGIGDPEILDQTDLRKVIVPKGIDADEFEEPVVLPKRKYRVPPAGFAQPRDK